MNYVVFLTILLFSTIAISSNQPNFDSPLLDSEKYTIQLSLEEDTHHFNNADELEAYIQKILGIFNENLGNKCEEFNQKLIENNYKACDPNYCLTQYTKGNRPDELTLSLSFGKHQWYGYYALASITWTTSTANKPTSRICVHPSLTQIAFEFESELRAKYMHAYYTVND